MVFLDKFLIQLLVAFMFPTNISQVQIPILCVLMIQAESQPKPAVILWFCDKTTSQGWIPTPAEPGLI